jgi:hypothetical protein
VTYELIETSSGNLVGAYPSQDLALLAIMETYLHSGEAAVATLALGCDDPSGQTDGQELARGATLLQLARDHLGGEIAR